MECFDCGNTITPQDHYCPKCGRQIRGRRRREHSTPPSWPQAESVTALNKILEENVAASERFKSQFIKWWFIALFPVAVALYFVWNFFALVVGVAIGGGIGIFIPLLTQPRGLSSAQYYSIPHSSTDNGKPRCIYCGHVGLYTHGQYRSYTKFHDCAKCSRNLYIS